MSSKWRAGRPASARARVVIGGVATHIGKAIGIATQKTTLDISGRSCAKLVRSPREGTTLRALVEQGLRRVVAGKQRRRVFRLRKASFKGRGLRPELAGASGDRLRDLAYEGRGG
jgi:hypothetical protein